MEWKLQSQRIDTTRESNDTNESLILRHETRRRIQAESDLILALDLLQKSGIKYSSYDLEEINTFLNQFK